MEELVETSGQPVEAIIIGLFVVGILYVIFRKRKKITVKTKEWKDIYVPKRGKGGKGKK
jgi:hypothetical protein